MPIQIDTFEYSHALEVLIKERVRGFSLAFGSWLGSLGFVASLSLPPSTLEGPLSNSSSHQRLPDDPIEQCERFLHADILLKQPFFYTPDIR